MKKNIKILLVEDEKLIRELVKDFLESDGFKVFEAGNGRDAFDLIKTNKFDLVISDVKMPGGDGIELAKNIQMLDGEKPIVIFITGFGDITEPEALEFGVVKIISKPFLPDDLVNFIKGLITSVQIRVSLDSFH
ncbi:MAG: response regulator [Bdellovibrionota bacterium]